MRELHGEWFRIRSRILDRGRDLELAEPRARVALDGSQLRRVWMAGEVEPEKLVEPDRLDHERVALPMPDRVAVPRHFEVVGVLASVHEDLAIAVNVAFEQEEQMRGFAICRRLHQTPWIRRDTRHARRQAARF